jgi:SAM-dependent MidA family methyltransferase
MNDLAARLRETIRHAGAISFRRFMEMALYEPELGYYERARVGRDGDFQTSVSAGPLFGQLLAWQFSAWLKELPGSSSPLMIIEGGAHDGRLAADILAALATWNPALAETIMYVCVEPSPTRRRWQEETLAPWRRQVRWVREWSELVEPVRGAIFCNELLDAIPFHRFSWNRRQRRWIELGVGLDRETFRWEPLERETADFSPALPDDLADALPDGFLAEHNPGAEHWWREAASVLQAGRLLAFDYGLDDWEFFAPGRGQGTARAYWQHHLVETILDRPGELDLTAHVNFTRVARSGIDAGLQTESDTSQGRFLTGLIVRLRASGAADDSWFARHSTAFHTLAHPDHFGRSFRVLVQTRPAPV